jgi:hypothetical protein
MASQWKIPLSDEETCFWTAHGAGCCHLSPCWGLHVVDGRVEFLGVGQDHATPVFLAKFVRDDPAQPWHGYPVHQKRVPDRPRREVLNVWLQQGTLRKAAIRKIMQGHPCTP